MSDRLASQIAVQVIIDRARWVSAEEADRLANEASAVGWTNLGAAAEAAYAAAAVELPCPTDYIDDTFDSDVFVAARENVASALGLPDVHGATDAAGFAALAAATRHLIGINNYTYADYDTLMTPWSRVIPDHNMG